MEQKISFFQKFIKSLNPSFSKEAIKYSPKEGFKYLFILTLFISLILSLKSTFSFYLSTRDLPSKAEKFFSENFQGFPKIEIKKGKVSSTKDPFLKEWSSGTTKIAFAVDTSARQEDVASGKYASYPEGLFILGNEFIIKTPDETGKISTEVYPFSKEMNLKAVFNPEERKFLRLEWDTKVFEITPEIINKWKSIFNLVLFPLSFIVFLFAFFIGKTFQALVFSIGSLIVNLIAKTKLTYKQLLNIGLFSLTTPFILENIVGLVPIKISGFNIFNSLLYLGLLIAGILQCRRPLDTEQNKNISEVGPSNLS